MLSYDFGSITILLVGALRETESMVFVHAFLAQSVIPLIYPLAPVPEVANPALRSPVSVTARGTEMVFNASFPIYPEACISDLQVKWKAWLHPS
jgi:hypothetical protein